MSLKAVAVILLFCSAPASASKPACELSLYLTPTRRRILVYGFNAVILAYAAHVDAEHNKQLLSSFDSGLAAGKPGAKDLHDAVEYGLLLPEDAARLFLNYQEELKDRLLPLRMRIREFVENELWTMSAAATAEQVLNDVLAGASTTEGLESRVRSHPQYPRLHKQIDERYHFTLRLWLAPNLQYRGKADIEWLKAGANRFAEEESLVLQIKRIADSIQTASNFIDPNSR